MATKRIKLDSLSSSLLSEFVVENTVEQNSFSFISGYVLTLDILEELPEVRIGVQTNRLFVQTSPEDEARAKATATKKHLESSGYVPPSVVVNFPKMYWKNWSELSTWVVKCIEPIFPVCCIRVGGDFCLEAICDDVESCEIKELISKKDFSKVRIFERDGKVVVVLTWVNNH